MPRSDPNLDFRTYFVTATFSHDKCSHLILFSVRSYLASLDSLQIGSDYLHLSAHLHHDKHCRVAAPHCRSYPCAVGKVSAGLSYYQHLDAVRNHSYADRYGTVGNGPYRPSKCSLSLHRSDCAYTAILLLLVTLIQNLLQDPSHPKSWL